MPLLRGTFDFGLSRCRRIPRSGRAPRRARRAATRATALANFYFGAFGNNYVDDGNVKRYREYYAMPGFGINELAAQRFVKQMVEWNLPPYIFERAGRPDFFLQSLRPAVFVTGLWTDPLNSKSDVAPHLLQHRWPDRPEVLGAALVRDDAVGRLCRGLPQLDARG